MSSARAKMLRAVVRAGHQTRSVPPQIPEFNAPKEVPPGRNVKVFFSADSSVTGKKADAMPTSASSTARLRMLKVLPSQVHKGKSTCIES